MSKGKIIVISGASGVGKSTVLKEVMKARQDLVFSVSATTRAPRPDEVNGVNYHHIIDPRTGKCPDNEIASVTVISPVSMYADALSTSIFVMGTDAISLCEKFPDTDAIIITEDGKTVTTDGFKKKYELNIH